MNRNNHCLGHGSQNRKRPREQDGALTHSRFILLLRSTMAYDEAHRYLTASDPRMAALIKRSVRYNVKPGKSVRPFDALAESIAYQQLSGKAAATIWGRVRALYPRKKHLDPKLVLKTPDGKFRAAGAKECSQSRCCRHGKVYRS